MDHIHNLSGLDYRRLQDQAAGNIDNSYSAATPISGVATFEWPAVKGRGLEVNHLAVPVIGRSLEDTWQRCWGIFRRMQYTWLHGGLVMTCWMLTPFHGNSCANPKHLLTSRLFQLSEWAWTPPAFFVYSACSFLFRLKMSHKKKLYALVEPTCKQRIDAFGYFALTVSHPRQQGITPNASGTDFPSWTGFAQLWCTQKLLTVHLDLI